MSRRRDLQWRRRQLEDMAGILDSMKSLAFMETRKVAHRQQSLNRVTTNLAQAALLFLGYYPAYREARRPAGSRVCVIIGSERGFCGDFNQRLIPLIPTDTDLLIAVGHKLQRAIEGSHPFQAVAGSSISDEIPDVLAAIVTSLEEASPTAGGLTIEVIYQTEDDAEPRLQQLLPPFQRLAEHTPDNTANGAEPLLYLAPARFFAELTDQYVFALLNQALYSSLLAENSRRVQHLDAAVSHLRDKSEQLLQTCNSLRQEEITEEIEVILLSAESALQVHQRHWERT